METMTQPPFEPRPAVVEALRKWRIEAARAEAVPSYWILTNRMLEAIAKMEPSELEQLAAAPGMGKGRLDKYGNGILEAVRQGVRGQPDEADLPPIRAWLCPTGSARIREVEVVASTRDLMTVCLTDGQEWCRLLVHDTLIKAIAAATAEVNEAERLVERAQSEFGKRKAELELSRLQFDRSFR